VIAQIADRVMVLYAGRAVEIAPAAVLLDEPLHPYTRALLTTLPRLGHRRRRLPTIPGMVPPVGSQLHGCRFANRCPLADAHCRTREPSLDTLSTGHQVACYKAGADVPGTTEIDSNRRLGHA
jgi:oligopeptide/dipeptide ABC transporter ATP-binding protein